MKNKKESKPKAQKTEVDMVFQGRLNIIEVNGLKSSILEWPATMEVDLQRGGSTGAAREMMTAVTLPRIVIDVEHGEMVCKGVAGGPIILGKICIPLSMLDMEQRKQLIVKIVVACPSLARYRVLE